MQLNSLAITPTFPRIAFFSLSSNATDVGMAIRRRSKPGQWEPFPARAIGTSAEGCQVLSRMCGGNPGE